jgi:PAT family beta-lactamase induction signal transducer AmpG
LPFERARYLPEVTTASKPSGKTIFWVNTTYFAEGLPFMIVRILSSVFFTQLGVKERYLGYLNFLGLPWNFKFLWAPLLDGWSTKRSWQVVLQAILGALTCLVGALAFMAGTAPNPELLLQAICAVFVVMAFVAATNDVAIDGFYLQALPRREDQALLSGYRVLAYRLAMVFSRSGVVGLVGFVASRYFNNSPTYAWAVGFGLSGAVMLFLALLHRIILPEVERPATDMGSLQKGAAVFWQSLATYLAQPKVALVLLFVILYKLGDEVLFSMVTPFLLRELALPTEDYAWIAGIVGALATVVGAMAGGWYIKKVGLRRALWPLTLCMNLNIWLYVWLSVAKPSPATFEGLATIAVVHGIEQLAAGLGSAALLVYLLTTCSKDFKATHYAIGSAIMSIPGTFVGGMGGQIVEAIGYTNLYILAFIAAIPSMIMIPWVPIREE